MKKLLTASLLLLSSLAFAQCDVQLLHDDYSNPSLWTPVVTTPGSITITGGTMHYNNLIGASYGRMYRPLPSPLPDNNWTATCAFKPISGNGVGHYVMAFTAGSLDPISYDASASYAYTNEDAIMVYYIYPNTPSSSGCCTSPAMGPWQLVARSKKGTTLAATSTGIPVTTLNQYTYVKLQRISTTYVALHAYSDSAMTSELFGSPVYYCIDPTITGLNTVQQGVVTGDGPIRSLSAQLDDLNVCTATTPDTTYVRSCDIAALQAPYTAANYTWSPATAACSTCAQASVTPPATGIDYYSVSITSGCVSLSHYFAVQKDTNCAAMSTCPMSAGPDTTVCAGAAVQLHATAGFNTYHWSPGAGLSDSTIANPVATLTDAISYTVTGITAGGGLGPNLLTNGDFGLGNTGFTSALNPTSLYSPGDYYIGPTFFTTGYATSGDHTPTADGNFMSVDGAPTLEVLWGETVSGLTPNTNYLFSFWNTLGNVSLAQFEVHMIGNMTGDVVLTTLSQPMGAPYPAAYWIWGQLNAPVWNSGANTSVTISVYNTELNGYGNDFGLDDFVFQTANSAGCIGADTVTLNISPPPKQPAVQDTTYCMGDATVPLNASGTNLEWYTSPGSGAGSSIAPVPSSAATGIQTYYVTQTQNGCSSDTARVQVTILDASPVFTLSRTQPECSQKTIVIGPANTTWHYEWQDGDTISPRTVSNSGAYALTATNACGSASDSVELVFEDCHCYFYVPNAFTPNSNGTNDVFIPKHDCIFENYHMLVFDRWGEKIFESTDPDKGWDGTYMGKPVELGVYIARFSYSAKDESGYFNPQTLITSVTVVR